MIKVTRHQVSTFRATAQAYLNQKPEVTVLSRALYHMLKRTKEIDEETQEKSMDFRIDLAVKESNDEKAVVVKNGQYNYTHENLKKLEKEIKKIRKEEVEIEEYIAKDLPNNLEFIFEEAFIPFVIKQSRHEWLYSEAEVAKKNGAVPTAEVSKL